MAVRDRLVIEGGYAAEITYGDGNGAAQVVIRRFSEATCHLRSHNHLRNPKLEDYETASKGAKASAIRSMRKLAAAEKAARFPAQAERIATNALLDLHDRCTNGTGMDDLDSVRPEAHEAVITFLHAIGHHKVADSFRAALGQ